mmetsp:Transcript_92453/g.146170  ORF Transcript_92453/g.146170 Transcript_92453/m.146170 type:complete len:254 (-) Transcript_92453:1353-2114(-)
MQRLLDRSYIGLNTRNRSLQRLQLLKTNFLMHRLLDTGDRCLQHSLDLLQLDRPSFLTQQLLKRNELSIQGQIRFPALLQLCLGYFILQLLLDVCDFLFHACNDALEVLKFHLSMYIGESCLFGYACSLAKLALLQRCHVPAKTGKGAFQLLYTLRCRQLRLHCSDRVLQLLQCACLCFVLLNARQLGLRLCDRCAKLLHLLVTRTLLHGLLQVGNVNLHVGEGAFQFLYAVAISFLAELLLQIVHLCLNGDD